MNIEQSSIQIAKREKMLSNKSVKFVRVAHTTASELRSFAAFYTWRWGLQAGE
jgi:hypothetical protein